MPSGYPHSRDVRWRLFDQICLGVPVWRAAQDMGVSTTAASIWWRNAGAMKLVGGRGGGVADPGNMSLPSGRGHRLSLDERIAIMRGLDAGLSHAQIGHRIGRDRITIWREVRRNRNPDGDYHARMAHARAARKAHRPKAFKLIDNPVCASIEAWMDDGWSPRLIAQMLARDHPDDRLARVSHETIYRCLYVQTRGSLRADLHKCLSTTWRRPKSNTPWLPLAEATPRPWETRAARPGDPLGGTRQPLPGRRLSTTNSSKPLRLHLSFAFMDLPPFRCAMVPDLAASGQTRKPQAPGLEPNPAHATEAAETTTEGPKSGVPPETAPQITATEEAGPKAASPEAATVVKAILEIAPYRASDKRKSLPLRGATLPHPSTRGGPP